MNARLRRLVRERAGNRCEYCRLHQFEDPVLGFHVEHIVPRKHRGSDDLSNLALACCHCNLHKGSNLSSIDPQSNSVVMLFNPRQNDWDEHFEIREEVVVGKTPCGRATAMLFEMNAPQRQQLRARLRD